MRPTAPLLAALGLAALLWASPAEAATEYGIEALSASESTSQAGAHPDLTIAFAMNRKEGSQEPVATTRDISISLPPGLIGNPNAVLKCSAAELVLTDINDPSNEASCPQDSQVGVTEIKVLEEGGLAAEFNEPIYNMESPGGDVVARLGFIAENFPVFINVELRPEANYAVTATLEGISSFIPLVSARTTIWGAPADESHNTERITPYEAVHCSGVPCTPTGERQSGLRPRPFMVNPTSCGEAQRITLTATSYADPANPVTKTAALPPISGCGRLGFAPTLEVRPTSSQAAAPTGLDATLTIPQDESVNGLATSQLRAATVTLPEGMTIAPGAADGLAACGASEVGFEKPGPSHCPAAAKIGSATFISPALPGALHGAVYQREPEPGHLFRIWLVADELGVHVKIPGEIHLDPATGQVSSVFLDTPQLPVEVIQLHFKEGARAPLATPPECGTYQTSYEFTPWSGASPVRGEAPMEVTQACGPDGFAPKLEAGTTIPRAGAFSPFLTKLVREGTGQNIAALSVTLPRGLLAKLAGVSLCPEAAAQTGACPSDSRVGSVTVATGPGSLPLWIPQQGKAPTAIYLAGPYHGAPYSLLVVVPAQAGPFDLGTVVTRAAIHIDPETAQVTVRSDPLPQILEGVPISYRTIYVSVDRKSFTLNPTSCRQKEVGATVTSTAGTVASPTDRFGVSGCGELPFKPKLGLRLFGPTRRAANPRLRAVLTAGPRETNLRRISVTLPHSEFLDQSHIRTICTRVQFAAGGGGGGQCPPGSVYGHATAFTPLLDFPLKGPVFLRANGGERELPDLVAALRGPPSQPVEVDLVGFIDSVRGGIRTRFQTVPDAPVSKFVLEMAGGRKGLLENHVNLCGDSHRARVKMGAQSGKVRNFRLLLRSDCTSQRKPHLKR